MAFILFSFHFFGKKGGIIIHTYIYDSPPCPLPSISDRELDNDLDVDGDHPVS